MSAVRPSVWHDGVMASRRTWLSISVELIEGRGTALWSRPGRIFAVSKQHTFERFAVAIDDAFARWDRAHLHEFQLFAPEQRSKRAQLALPTPTRTGTTKRP